MNQEKLKWNILSEEAGFIDNGGDKTLVIDPIDGTYNAVIGIPFYSVSLALGTSTMSDVNMAYVRNIVTGDSYEAVKGEGAKLNGRKIHVRPLSKDMVLLIYMGRHATEDNFQHVRKAPAHPLARLFVTGAGISGAGHRRRVLSEERTEGRGLFAWWTSPHPPWCCARLAGTWWT